MRCDIHEIAGFQVADLAFIGETQTGFTGQDGDPFAFGLVVPEAGRTALAGGYDAFDTHAGMRQQLGKTLAILAIFGSRPRQ